MPNRTIVILYVPIGYGHRRAAAALESSLNTLAPEIQVVCLDIFELWPPWIGSLLVCSYRAFIRIFPRIWSYLYDHQDVKRKVSRLLLFVYRLCRGRIGLLLDELQPALIASTQALPNSLLAVYKKDLNLKLPLVAVPTDFAVHSYWIDDMVDRYLLPSEESRREIISRGVPAGKIRVTGIPVAAEYIRTRRPDMIKRKYGLDPRRPVILLMGGGEGNLGLGRLIGSLDKRPEDFQLAALAGRNLKEIARLKRMAPKLSHPLRIFGFTRNVGEIMEAVEAVITKPGGLTVAEVLAASRPLILTDPLPGPEELNARFLLKRGAALWAEDEERAAVLTGNILSDPSRREALFSGMKKIARPNSAETAARYILEITGSGNGGKNRGVTTAM